MSRAIGGFFPLAPGGEASSNNYLSLWDVDLKNSLFFHNLRSAFWYLLTSAKPRKIWLPAYICPAMNQAAVKSGTTTEFYPINENLSPDVSFLESRLESGEGVVAVDYFGRNPGEGFLQLVKETNDIIWIEDRAQALNPSDHTWGDYILYSPRKLIGVPDGGILVSNSGELPSPANETLQTSRFVEAYRLRQQDLDEENNDKWYSIFSQYETEMVPGLLAMSDISMNILSSTDPNPHIRQRSENYEVLFETLEDIALFKKATDSFTPLGFPIKVSNCMAIAAQLASRRIFVPRYWPELPSEVREFGFEHSLAESVLVLPCDHRYGDAEMLTIARSVKELL